jgi:hypothetical protein
MNGMSYADYDKRSTAPIFIDSRKYRGDLPQAESNHAYPPHPALKLDIDTRYRYPRMEAPRRVVPSLPPGGHLHKYNVWLRGGCIVASTRRIPIPVL